MKNRESTGVLLIFLITAGCHNPIQIDVLDTSAECEGLLPEVPGLYMTVASKTTDEFLGGSSDGFGNVVLEYQREAPLANVFEFVAPNGRALGNMEGWHIHPLFGQPTGYQLMYANGESPTQAEHRTSAPDGTIERAASVLRPGTVDQVLALADDPAGGSLLVRSDVDDSHNHFFSVMAQRFAADGAALSDAAFATSGPRELAPKVIGGAVSTLGSSLVAWEARGKLAGLWLSPTGSPLTSQIDTDAAIGQLLLVPLLDGSVLVRVDDARTLVFDPAGNVLPVPAWIADLPEHSRIERARGDRAYAILPPETDGLTACEQAIEIRAVSGKSCGRVRLSYEGTTCQMAELRIGRDGTVIQRNPRSICDSADPSTCTSACDSSQHPALCRLEHRWWTALLR